MNVYKPVWLCLNNTYTCMYRIVARVLVENSGSAEIQALNFLGCMFQETQTESRGLSVIFCLTNVKLLPPALYHHNKFY